MKITKDCSGCGLTKDILEFGKSKSTKDGLSWRCLECKREYENKYNKENKKKRASNNKRYQQKNKEKIKAQQKIYKKKNKIKFRLGAIRRAMIQRCDNVSFAGFKHYGAKGVSVCEEWYSYDLFEEWAIKNGYKSNLTIDRIDTTKGYSPDNCQWITQHEQVLKQDRNKNRTKNDLYIYANKCGTYRVEISTGTKKRRVVHYMETRDTKEEAVECRDHFIKTGGRLEYKNEYCHTLSKKKKEYLKNKRKEHIREKNLLTLN